MNENFIYKEEEEEEGVGSLAAIPGVQDAWVSRSARGGCRSGCGAAARAHPPAGRSSSGLLSSSWCSPGHRGRLQDNKKKTVTSENQRERKGFIGDEFEFVPN